ncbi:hypothetical protein ACFV4N_19780 [Actinosynnema sp. NPDC059797]
MFWLFTQMFILCVLAFVAGAVLTWLPLRATIRELRAENARARRTPWLALPPAPAPAEPGAHAGSAALPEFPELMITDFAPGTEGRIEERGGVGIEQSAEASAEAKHAEKGAAAAGAGVEAGMRSEVGAGTATAINLATTWTVVNPAEVSSKAFVISVQNEKTREVADAEISDPVTLEFPKQQAEPPAGSSEQVKGWRSEQRGMGLAERRYGWQGEEVGATEVGGMAIGAVEVGSVEVGSVEVGSVGTGAVGAGDVAFGTPRAAAGGAAADHGGVVVKCNSRSMVFHTSASPYFKRMKGEVTFASAEEAVRAGYAPWVPKPKAVVKPKAANETKAANKTKAANRTKAGAAAKTKVRAASAPAPKAKTKAKTEVGANQ